MGGVIVPSHEIDNHVKQRLKMRRNTLPANHTTSERFVEFVSFNINVSSVVKESSMIGGPSFCLLSYILTCFSLILVNCAEFELD